MSAAREIFRKQGFIDATADEIAKVARVGKGTLFRYATDKHQLLLMVLDDELTEITDVSIARVDRRQPLVNQLVELYRRRFEFWASDVDLARAATAQAYASRAPEEKPERTRVQLRQERLISVVAGLIVDHAESNKLALRDDPHVIADALHYIYIGELRVWLNGARPRASVALTRLQRLFRLLLEGIFEPVGAITRRR